MSAEQFFEIAPKLFVAAAETRPELWHLLEGAECEHPRRGRAQISGRDTKNLDRVNMTFADGLGVFSMDLFTHPEIILTLRLPRLGAEDREYLTEVLAEVESLQRCQDEFEPLLARFGLPDDPAEFNAPLYAILKKLDDGVSLSVDECDYLKASRRYRLAAEGYEVLIGRSPSPWHVVNACSAWRGAGEPTRAVEITDSVAASGDATSALWTTRGGAFRDLGDLTAAEECALKALADPKHKYHPHNLLGAVYFERGEHERGEEQFRMAVKLDAPPRSIEQVFKSIGERSVAAAHRGAEYLLRVDPTRYAWATRFIQHDRLSRETELPPFGE